MTEEFTTLFAKMKEASRRTLYEEIRVVSTDDAALPYSPQPKASPVGRIDTPPATKRFKLGIKEWWHSQSWEQLLAESSEFLPFMTEEQVGKVWRFAAIFLLGYLVPTSTGNDFFILQNCRTRDLVDEAVTTVGSAQAEQDRRFRLFYDMELEERLENCIRFFDAGAFGEIGCVTFSPRERAFRSFLENGLGKFLSVRTAHPYEVDLLHILAMGIAPVTSPESVPVTARALDEKDGAAWRHAKKYFNLTLAHALELNYAHRLALISLVADKLVIPELNSSEEWPSGNTTLVEGALPHLRAALHSFGRVALYPTDAWAADRALVNVAVQRKEEVCCLEEWEMLMKRVSEKCSFCTCTCETGFCSLRATGTLIHEFILRYNESRHYGDMPCMNKATKSIVSFLEDYIDTLSNASHESRTVPLSSCFVASLLTAARSLFYFYLYDGKGIPLTTDEKHNDSSDAHESLIRCAIKLLQSSDRQVVQTASLSLVVACSYCPPEKVPGYAGAVLLIVRHSFEDENNVRLLNAMKGVASAICRLSNTFASSLMRLLLSGLDKTSRVEGKRSVWSLAAAISMSQPMAARWEQKTIIRCWTKEEDSTCLVDITQVVFACRQAYLFEERGDDLNVSMERLVTSIASTWDHYHLAGCALITGNFDVATRLYDRLTLSVSTDASHLWVTALSNIAEGEACVLGGPGGLSRAIALFSSAIAKLEYLASRDAAGNRFVFQTTFLMLRIDFIELCMALRYIVREMRLTNSIPKLTTRTGVHLRKVLKCFKGLASRYHSVYKKYGLFLMQQSRTALRTYYAVNIWLSEAGRKILLRKPGSKSSQDSTIDEIHGDQLLPSITLLKKLDDLVLKKLEPSLAYSSRGAAMTEIVDAFLRTPSPIPQDLVKPSQQSPAFVRLSPGTEGRNNSSLDGGGVLLAYPGVPLSINVSGMLTQDVAQSSRLSFHRIILRSGIRYTKPIDLEAGGEDGEEEAESSMHSSNFPPLVSVDDGPLLQDGKFFFGLELPAIPDEGVYLLTIKLGCRDVRGDEWQLAVDGDTCLEVRVCR